MLPEERKNYIYNIINERKVVKVSELSKELELTEATIRRDLEELQSEKKLRRTHGGAVALQPEETFYVIRQLATIHVQEKQAIAKKAYEFIEDGDTLILDASSTTQELCKLIAEGNKKELTVITNAFSVVNILRVKHDMIIIHTGGVVEPKTESSIGDFAVRQLSKLKADKVFMGVNGIDPEFGYSITNLNEGNVKRAMINCAAEVFVIADHSKFSSTFLSQVAEPEGEVDYLITDRKHPKIDYSVYEKKVHLIFAEETGGCSE